MTQRIHGHDLLLVTPLWERPKVNSGLSVGEIRSKRSVLVLAVKGCCA
jgi:hypothetical protein